MRAVFRVCDFETTGFDPAVDEICEIGARDLIVDDGRVVGRTQTVAHLCNPGIPIPPTSRAVHHISDAMVEQAKYRPAELVEKLVAGANATSDAEGRVVPAAIIPVVLVAHNAEFEASFVAKHGATALPWLCTFRLAMHLWPTAPSYKNEVLRYWRMPEREFEGLPHRAAHDVDVTSALFELLLADWLAMREETGELDNSPQALITYASAAVDLSHRPMGFGKHAEILWRDCPRDYLQWMVRQGKDAWDRDQWLTVHRVLGWRSPQ